MDRRLLSEEDLDKALASLPGWVRDSERGAIVRRFTFPNFSEAFAWMTRMALLAEKMDHHPDWHNVYGTVDVCLTTHDRGGITALDVHMAEVMNRYVGEG